VIWFLLIKCNIYKLSEWNQHRPVIQESCSNNISQKPKPSPPTKFPYHTPLPMLLYIVFWFVPKEFLTNYLKVWFVYSFKYFPGFSYLIVIAHTWWGMSVWFVNSYIFNWAGIFWTPMAIWSLCWLLIMGRTLAFRGSHRDPIF